MALLVFIDESGKPTIAERSPFVLAALLVDEAAYHELQSEVDYMINRVLMRYARNYNFSLNPRLWELHAKEIVQNKGNYRYLGLDARVAIFEGAMNILKDFARDDLLEAIVVAIIKDKVLNTVSRRSEVEKAIVSKAYGLLMERVVWALESDPVGRRHDIAILVVDESEINEDVKDTVRYELTQGIYTSRLESSTRVLPDPIFTKSSHYRGLQLADIIAYVAQRVLTGRFIAAGGRFDFKRYWDDLMRYVLRKGPNGRVEGYGLKIWRM